MCRCSCLFKRREKTVDSLSLTECIQKLGVNDSKPIITFLENQKRNGFIYYKEDLNTIPEDTQFDLYFSETKGFIKNNHAFPISRNLYHSLKINHWSFRWLSFFYHLYYQETSPSPFEWQDWDFYIGGSICLGL